MTIDITRFDDAKAATAKRLSHCKNCFFDNEIHPGQGKVIISGGIGCNTRHVSLCPKCAEWEATLLEQLARKIRTAARLAS